jgi:hypothetical protein
LLPQLNRHSVPNAILVLEIVGRAIKDSHAQRWEIWSPTARHNKVRPRNTRIAR